MTNERHVTPTRLSHGQRATEAGLNRRTLGTGLAVSQSQSRAYAPRNSWGTRVTDLWTSWTEVLRLLSDALAASDLDEQSGAAIAATFDAAGMYKVCYKRASDSAYTDIGAVVEVNFVMFIVFSHASSISEDYDIMKWVMIA